jgi:hypothetical protein
VKEIASQLQLIALACRNAREYSDFGQQTAAISQLAMAIGDLATLVERIHQAYNNRR